MNNMEDIKVSTATIIVGYKIGKDIRDIEGDREKSTREKQQVTLIVTNFRKNASFFNVRLVAPLSQKPIYEAINMCETIHKILKDTDPSVILTCLKGEEN